MKQTLHALIKVMLSSFLVCCLVFGSAGNAQAGLFDKLGEGLGIKSSGKSLPSPIKSKLTPYDESIPFAQQYPRIAVTVIKTPSDHKTNMTFRIQTRDYPNASYTLKARIWYSATKYEDTQEFNWSSPDDIAYGTALTAFWDWSNKPGIVGSAMLDGSSGSKRTTGPVPPKTPFPTDIKHAQFLGRANGRVGDTLDGTMMASLAYVAGIDPSTLDRRFWIVEFTEAVQ